ncbi:sulfotransferase family protein [Streptomyces sp. 4N509B]|uniref:sulfotransferase family protein n=1 Tax=Streptomyces sp. 4N509B TaxID=3457413 RepID=UPI003FD64A05
MLDVLGVGAGRTGTMSLKNALEMLGFTPCHHMLHMLEHPEDIPLWDRVASGEEVDWQEVYAGYRASVDWPGARYWREITAAFPEARVILTLRDPDSWYESCLGSIYPAAMSPAPPGAAPQFEALRKVAVKTVWDGVFDGRFSDREHALRVYREHNEAVVREVASDRLLVFEVKQGWEPLCSFLGVPVPDAPFPRSNDRAQFATMVSDHTDGDV